MQNNQQLIDQAFKLLHEITQALASTSSGLKRECLLGAQKRAYRRFLRRMGF